MIPKLEDKMVIFGAFETHCVPLINVMDLASHYARTKSQIKRREIKRRKKKTKREQRKRKQKENKEKGNKEKENKTKKEIKQR
uniref:Uncharacterized protein n=1 Tax=Romanomermis culicivorax TaxID=13658 RepID=A0A915HH90_ROMCU